MLAQRVLQPRLELAPGELAMRQAATQIADRLGEQAYEPRMQIVRIVRVLGSEQAQALCRDALELESMGGMVLPDGRRRTVGGIFFRLVKGSINREQYLRIWPLTARSTAAQPPNVTDVPNLTGEVHRVKIQLVGRPGRIIAKQGYIMTTMQSSKVPALPKGLPTPATSTTVYTLYLSLKQWAKVAQALKSPDDLLIVEGAPVYDPDLEGIAVYAMNATTRALHQAQRAASGKTPAAV